MLKKSHARQCYSVLLDIVAHLCLYLYCVNLTFVLPFNLYCLIVKMRLIQRLVHNDAMKADPPEIYGWRVYLLACAVSPPDILRENISEMLYEPFSNTL
jgi:hypothetical protein